MGLPSGQSVAHFMGLTPLTPAELFDSDDQKKVLAQFPTLGSSTPLWYYILKEAERTKKTGVTDTKGGHHLGPVGGRIVAEVLVGLAVADHHSYLSQAPHWQPTLAQNGVFTMADLIRFVETPS